MDTTQARTQARLLPSRASSEGASAEQRDSSKPSAARTIKNTKSAAKGPDLDPTGHEGSYNPSID